MDDGVATGGTVRAAIGALRSSGRGRSSSRCRWARWSHWTRCAPRWTTRSAYTGPSS
ncbi:hypothetical protein ACN28S_30395 [Cystobacter fuscus]